MIERGLRARIQTLSLVTGQKMINLDFVPEATSCLVGDSQPLQIPTIPSELEELSQRLERLPIDETLRSIASLAEKLNQVLASPEWKSGTRDMTGTIVELRSLVREATARITPLASDLQATLHDTRTLLGSSDTLVRDSDAFVRTLNGRVVPLASDVEKTLQEARAALAKAGETMEALQGDYGGSSDFHNALVEILQRLKNAAQSVEALSDYLRRHPESLLWGTGTQH
jgi:paraquat-inducible protein B